MSTKIFTLQIASRSPHPGVAVLEMKGSIHAGPDCNLLSQEVDKVIEAKSKGVVLDLAGVTHIDSAAIGMIVTCFSKVKRSGGVLCLAGAKGMVEGTLKLTQIDKAIRVFPAASDAADGILAV